MLKWVLGLMAEMFGMTVYAVTCDLLLQGLDHSHSG